MDLFRKWSSDESTVRCEGNFPMYAFSSNGRIVKVDDGELRVMSDDMRSELIIKLSPELDFHYADSRHVTGVAKQYDSCVVMFFSPIEAEGPHDTISIAVTT